MVHWKRNFIVVWVSQFLSILGFTFAMPFVPFFMQRELGVSDPGALKMWVALFAASAPLSLAVFSPIWGAVGDRYGRRLMLIRANLGAAVMLALMGRVETVGMLIVLRSLQGFLTGTMTAAQAMVSVQTPNHRSGFVLGALSSAVFSGATIGGAVGGLVADAFGCRIAFMVGAYILAGAALLVVLGTEEQFVSPAVGPGANASRHTGSRALLIRFMPMLLLMVFLAMVRRFDAAFVPLLVQDVRGGVAGAARWTGILFAGGGTAGFLSGIFFGHLSDRIDPRRLGRYAALGAGLLMLPQAFARGFLVLFCARVGVAFLVAGLEPIFQSWISRQTPAHCRGVIFGWGATVRSLGWLFSPLLAGGVAWLFDLRAIFIGSALLYFALIPLIGVTVRKEGTKALKR